MDSYADMVRRICFVHLKNKHDTEDVFQNVYMKYMLYEGSFENDGHEKAWFARVTINACKDLKVNNIPVFFRKPQNSFHNSC